MEKPGVLAVSSCQPTVYHGELQLNGTQVAHCYLFQSIHTRVRRLNRRTQRGIPRQPTADDQLTTVQLHPLQVLLPKYLNGSSEKPMYSFENVLTGNFVTVKQCNM